MLCVTGMYLRDIANMIFVILLLNVSHLSICSSCFVWFIIVYWCYHTCWNVLLAIECVLLRLKHWLIVLLFVCRMVHPTQGGWLAPALQPSVCVYIGYCTCYLGVRLHHCYHPSLNTGYQQFRKKEEKKKNGEKKKKEWNLPKTLQHPGEQRLEDIVWKVFAFSTGIRNG